MNSSVLPPDESPGFLNRRLSRRQAEEQMAGAYEVLLTAIKYGCLLLNRIGRTADDTWMRDSSFRLLWQYLEALDATDQLIREGAIQPAHVHARNVFDIGIQLLYLLDRDSERLAAAYTTARRRKYLKSAQRFVKGSQKRKELRAEAQKSVIPAVDLIDRLPDTEDEVRRLEESLQEDLWKEANQELKRLEARGDPWFAAFEKSAPTDRAGLAREVGYPLHYRFFYKPWSRVVHGMAPEKPFTANPESGTVTVEPFRKLQGWETLVSVTYGFTLSVYRRTTAYFRPGEKKGFARWYVNELRPHLENSPLSLPQLDERLAQLAD